MNIFGIGLERATISKIPRHLLLKIWGVDLGRRLSQAFIFSWIMSPILCSVRVMDSVKKTRNPIVAVGTNIWTKWHCTESFHNKAKLLKSMIVTWAQPSWGNIFLPPDFLVFLTEFIRHLSVMLGEYWTVTDNKKNGFAPLYNDST